MTGMKLNRFAGWTLVALSLIALSSVISGYFQTPRADEGTAAHLFQLSILLSAVVALVFVLTADWKRRWLTLRPLLVSGAALVLAFGALFYLEHYYYAVR